MTRLYLVMMEPLRSCHLLHQEAHVRLLQSLYQSLCAHNATMCPTWLNFLQKAHTCVLARARDACENALVRARLRVFVIEITCAASTACPPLCPVQTRQLWRGSELSYIPGETPEAGQLQCACPRLSLPLSLLRDAVITQDIPQFITAGIHVHAHRSALTDAWCNR